ncbi:MAG: hypothetical protein J6B40_07880 [Oscillospiraceae bacterium]|nr:hypothetical protein [Oscillospiraceae bacterium]
MKKVLSLILALIMLVAMAVPAFADDGYDLVMTDKSDKKLGDDGQMLPGETYYIEMTNGTNDISVDKRDFKIEFDIVKGSKYVADHGLEDGEFFITVANNHSLTVDNPGYIDFEITLTAKDDWTSRGIEKGEKFYYSDSYDVGNDIYYVDTYEDAEDAEIYDGTGSAISFAADDRGWVIFDCGPIDIQMRLGSRAIAFDPDESKIAAIDKLAKNSVPKCVNFLAQPTISGTATFMVDDDYDYVYSFDGTKLTRIDVKEDGRHNTWKMTDVTLGTFVLSTESLAGSVAQQPASQPEAPAPAPQSSAAPAPAPVPESSAAPAPAPESSVAEPAPEPEEPAVDITPEPEPETEPAPETEAEEEEPVEAPVEEEEPSKSLMPVVLMILAAAIVVAILIALLVARSGKKSRR